MKSRCILGGIASIALLVGVVCFLVLDESSEGQDKENNMQKRTHMIQSQGSEGNTKKSVRHKSYHRRHSDIELALRRSHYDTNQSTDTAAGAILNHPKIYSTQRLRKLELTSN
eukprot:CAMPEP_0198298450 /NCGR_PEP_ID=MMETSP1449-20131203/40888_1 /TAXON_ID=420275 /ORGANISM="Attheya septentrionalis, Strain CCMP2084" /LENGTH=112 /DNA_ID=CAMNT_0043999709 /DNA_START=108 /DNA_END=446 /DNA_ORIENTATION=-